jgi:transglycosylase-like protein with SLT domain
LSRFIAGAVFGLVVGVVAGAAAGLHAQDPDDSQQVAHAAELAGVDPVDLKGAMNTTGVADPFTYLRQSGEMEHPPPLPPPPVKVIYQPPSSAIAECIIQRESHGNPGAVNPRSGAAGLGQFLPGTWLTTPQGRAGLSVFDPAANRAAVNWMLSVGRGREFVTIGGCR